MAFRRYAGHEMNRKQMAGPRSANFVRRMHDDKISLPKQFHPNRQRSFKVKYSK